MVANQRLPFRAWPLSREAATAPPAEGYLTRKRLLIALSLLLFVEGCFLVTVGLSAFVRRDDVALPHAWVDPTLGAALLLAWLLWLWFGGKRRP